MYINMGMSILYVVELLQWFLFVVIHPPPMVYSSAVVYVFAENYNIFDAISTDGLASMPIIINANHTPYMYILFKLRKY